MSIVLPANRPVLIGGSPSRSLALSPDGNQLVYVGLNLDAPANQLGGRTQLASLNHPNIAAIYGLEVE